MLSPPSPALNSDATGITLDIYNHLYEPMRQEAASIFDAALGGL